MVEDRLIAYNGWGQADCIQRLRTGWLHTMVEDRLTVLTIVEGSLTENNELCHQVAVTHPQHQHVATDVQCYLSAYNHTISWAFRIPTMLFLIYQERQHSSMHTTHQHQPLKPEKYTVFVYHHLFVCLFLEKGVYPEHFHTFCTVIKISILLIFCVFGSYFTTLSQLWFRFFLFISNFEKRAINKIKFKFKKRMKAKKQTLWLKSAISPQHRPLPSPFSPGGQDHIPSWLWPRHNPVTWPAAAVPASPAPTPAPPSCEPHSPLSHLPKVNRKGDFESSHHHNYGKQSPFLMSTMKVMERIRLPYVNMKKNNKQKLVWTREWSRTVLCEGWFSLNQQ